MPVSELIDQLERTYCGAVAAEFEHLTVSGHICGALSQFGNIEINVPINVIIIIIIIIFPIGKFLLFFVCLVLHCLIYV